MADDKPASVLAPIRKTHADADRLEAAGNMDGALLLSAVLAQSIPRLLAAVDAALACHQRVNLYGNAATGEEPGACPHDPDSPLHFEPTDEPGEWLCEGRPEGAVCSSCVDGEGGERIDWPCPEHEAILGALTGKAADGG